MKSTPLGFKKWLAFLLAGLVGQLAWAIENNYLNLYVFSASHDYSFITTMTVLSAVAATITTLFIGALSDKLGKRKLFVSIGYILWGISIILFAFLDPTSKVTIVANSGFLAGVMIVIMDCVMTFFGSTANDACFNASINDHTDSSNRKTVESVLATLPLFAMIIVTVVGGMFGVGSTDGVVHWDYFFYLFGGLTLLIGVLCLVLYPKDNCESHPDEKYMYNLVYGFRPQVVKDNKNLYLSLIAFLIFNTAIQCFMPYFMIYIQRGLGIVDIENGPANFTVTLGIVLVVASIITIVVGIFMNKIKFNILSLSALGVGVTGAIIMCLVKDQIGVIFGGIILMTGYLVSTAILSAKIRDNIPHGREGSFQGVRMIFVVMLPMVIGPYLGLAASHINEILYVDETYGNISTQPNQYIFLFTAIIMLLVLIPLFILMKREKDGQTSK